MKMECDFLFHAIGQGCFYTGSIRPKLYKPFYLVYDCGSDREQDLLKADIGSFKAETGNELDLLMISHFDYDHVSGVAGLLKEPTIHCRRLVIPYYDPEERLLLYTTTASPDEEYRRMLQDPLGYFSEFNIDEIIVVGAPGDDNPGEAIGNNFPDGPPLPDQDGEGKVLPFRDDHDENAARRWKETVKSKENSFSGKVKFVTVPYRMVIGIALWEFIFYLKKADNILLRNRFNEDIQKLIRHFKTDIYGLFDPERIDELKTIYREHYGQNLNNTSLVTLHRPAFKSPDYNTIFGSDGGKWSKRPGTLLTGDIDLRGPSKLNKVSGYYNSKLNSVGYFQVPHHGSALNWPEQPDAHALHQFPNFIINHGIGRKHHPGDQVLNDINEKAPEALVHHNTEQSSFGYRFKFLSNQDIIMIG